MYRIVVLLAAASAMFVSSASADQLVNGYYNSHGTYVSPYYRSSPDNSYNNNFSTSPNVNPYTGKEGTKQPTYNDQPPPKSSFPSYSTYGGDAYGQPSKPPGGLGGYPSTGLAGACKSLYC